MEYAQAIAVVVLVVAFVVALVAWAFRIYRARVDAPLATADLLARLHLLAVEQVENQRRLIQRLDRMAEALDLLAYGDDEASDE